MPGGDRTGPNGLGPMTGRAAGFCRGGAISANNLDLAGFSFGRGGYGRMGGGRGRRNMFYGNAASYQTPDTEMEKVALKNHAEALQVQLNIIKKRITDIESK